MLHISTHVYIYVHMNTIIYIYINMYTYIIYIHIHRWAIGNKTQQYLMGYPRQGQDRSELKSELFAPRWMQMTSSPNQDKDSQYPILYISDRPPLHSPFVKHSAAKYLNFVPGHHSFLGVTVVFFLFVFETAGWFCAPPNICCNLCALQTKPATARLVGKQPGDQQHSTPRMMRVQN